MKPVRLIKFKRKKIMYVIEYATEINTKDTKILLDGLSVHAKASKDLAPAEQFAFFLRDHEKKIIGGCEGSIYYGCIFVDLLWVAASIRNQGYGSRLMREAEKLGRDKYCLFMAVNTMDWEGLEFYKKLGFEVEFVRKGYSKDSTAYFLRKNL